METAQRERRSLEIQACQIHEVRASGPAGWPPTDRTRAAQELSEKVRMMEAMAETPENEPLRVMLADIQNEARCLPACLPACSLAFAVHD